MIFGDLKEQINEDIEELYEAFSLFDKDYNGVITPKELGIIMQSISLNPTESEIKEMINEAETDQSGSVDFPEFLALLARKTIANTDDEEQMKNMFNFFSNCEHTHIDAKSLGKVLESLDEPVDKKTLEELVIQSDVSGEGTINYEGTLYLYKK